MTKERFNELVDYMIEKSGKTLKEKNAKYAPEDDALHNFHYGAQMDSSTTAQTIWHYWKKHLVALMDKINSDNWEDLVDAEEKIQDSINYLLFIWCAANEAHNVNSAEKNCELDKDYMNEKCKGCFKGCLIHEAPCDCCAYFETMCENPDDNPKSAPYPCVECNHNFCHTDPEYLEHRSQFVYDEELDK